MYTPRLSDRVNLRLALGVGDGCWGSRTREWTTLKTTSKPRNKWVRHFPTIWILPNPYPVLTAARESLHGALTDGMEAQGDFLSSSLCVAVSHKKPLRQWEEFFFSRSIKTEGCWRSLAGIRVEPSWFLYIFPFLLLSPPAHFSKSQQGLEGRSRTRLHVESKWHTLDLSRELTTACGSSAPSN